jgi:hypothetical protein
MRYSDMTTHVITYDGLTNPVLRRLTHNVRNMPYLKGFYRLSCDPTYDLLSNGFIRGYLLSFSCYPARIFVQTDCAKRSKAMILSFFDRYERLPYFGGG